MKKLWREGIEHRSRVTIVYLISNWGENTIYIWHLLNVPKITRFLGGPNIPKICVAETKFNFKDLGGRSRINWKEIFIPKSSSREWKDPISCNKIYLKYAGCLKKAEFCRIEHFQICHKYRVFFLTGPPLKMSLDWPPPNLLGLAPPKFP